MIFTRFYQFKKNLNKKLFSKTFLKNCVDLKLLHGGGRLIYLSVTMWNIGYNIKIKSISCTLINNISNKPTSYILFLFIDEIYTFQGDSDDDNTNKH